MKKAQSPEFAPSKISNEVITTAEVNVRASAAGSLIGTQPVGAIGTINGGPIEQPLGGTPVTWYLIQFTSSPPEPSGWVGDDNLVAYTQPAPGPGPGPIPEATHFVSTSGSDSNSGASSDQAWKTIGKAISAAPAGSVVQIGAGTYSESPNFTGSATFQASGEVIVTGPVKLSGSGNLVQGLKSGMKTLLNSGSNPPAFLVDGDHNVLQNCILDGATWGGSGGDEGVCFIVRGNSNTLLKCQASNIDNLDAYRIFGTGNTIDGCVSFNHSNSRYSEGPHADYVQSWGGMRDCTVQNCMFYGSLGSPHQWGIFDTNPGGDTTNCQNFTFRNNVTVGSQHMFVFIRNSKLYNNLWYHSADNIGDLLFFDSGNYSPYDLKNNAFVQCGTNSGNGFIQGGIQGGVTVDHNFFCWQNNSQVSHGTGNAAVNGGDPKFVNPDSRDFHTQSGSVLRGKGVAISPAFSDKDGKARTGAWDIGPYQS